jgi:hypothetical protein
MGNLRYEAKAKREAERRKKIKSLTVPKMKKSVAKAAEIEATVGLAGVPKQNLFNVADNIIRVDVSETQRETKRIRRYGGSPKVVAFSEGVHSGLGYASRIVHSASRGGRILDRKGHAHKQKRGSIIR